jgi:mono/diheme cytochrome c family protein
LARGLALMPYEDPELAALRLELRTLEAQVVALSQEQAEVERLIQEFARRQQATLGDLLEESLRLRQLYWQRQAERREATDADREAHAQARDDYADYQQSREEVEQMPAAPRLDPDQQAELKRLFREACMQCHPDRVTEPDQAQAGALFIQVRAAYQQGDLHTLRRLHRQLKSGRPFADPVTVLTEGDQLRRRVAQLRLEVERLLAVLKTLHAHETYRTLASLADWDRYFAEARQRLAEDIERLRAQLEDDDDQF